MLRSILKQARGRLRQARACWMTRESKPSQLPPRLSPGQRVIFVKRDGIGDFILSTTLLSRVQKAYPEGQFSLACNEIFADLARVLYPTWTIFPLPDMNRNGCLPFFRSAMKRAIERIPPQDLLVDLRAYRFANDAVISSWIPATTKLALENQCKEKIRRHPRESRIYHYLPAAAQVEQSPELCQDIVNYRTLLNVLLPGDSSVNAALPSISGLPPWRLSPSAGREGSGIDPQRTLALAPFPGAGIREYPLEAMLKIAGAVAQKWGLEIALLGGTHDVERARQALERQSIPVLLHNLVGRLSLVENSSLLSGVKVLFTVETGHAHLAIAAGTPTLVLLGGGHFGQFAPWGASAHAVWMHLPMDCYGCDWKCTRDYPHCILDIPAEAIQKQLERVLLSREHEASRAG
jgi:ADP-heptose:LPS heptosyltransferase